MEKAMIEGDTNSLAVRALPATNRAEMESIPVGSHIVVGTWDHQTIRPTFEGYEWDEQIRAQVIGAMAAVGDDGSDPDRRYAAIVLYVPPLTDKEADQIADQVIANTDLGTGVSHTDDNAVDAFRSGWLNASDLRAMLASAAKAGRGL